MGFSRIAVRQDIASGDIGLSVVVCRILADRVLCPALSRSLALSPNALGKGAILENIPKPNVSNVSNAPPMSAWPATFIPERIVVRSMRVLRTKPWLSHGGSSGDGSQRLIRGE